ncbi:MAG TPA: hypothetical protein VME45_18785 [Stellaceae bacterium]|nr:hypothetical protein [Stellaceae bacterium]
MCSIHMLEPVAASSEPFASAAGNFVAEPDLADLMRDPMTEALMTADRVDHNELCTLLLHVRESLR